MERVAQAEQCANGRRENAKGWRATLGYLADCANVKVESTLKADYAAHARIIKALAHPTRLFILDKVSSGTHSVNELTDMVGADMSTVSRHLSVLRNVGILQDEKRGARVFYRVRLPCVLQVFKCIEAIEHQHGQKNL